MNARLVLGTRGSDLARRQTDYVLHLLQRAWQELEAEIRVISTRGDRTLDTPLPLIGGKGLFTAELEAALRNHTIDLAVHSLKDLPSAAPSGLIIGAIPPRASAADALISRAGYTLATLPQGAAVGTSSLRRAAQLLHQRPDLRIVDIRGNVDTRVRKALDPYGLYDAIVLACAGLDRLGLSEHIREVLPFEIMLPAPGQGALAVQCRDDSADRLVPIHHLETAQAVTAERAFLTGLGGGCTLPVAAYANVENGEWTLRGRVSSVDGRVQIDVKSTFDPDDAEQAGANLAREALAQGASTLLDGRS